MSVVDRGQNTCPQPCDTSVDQLWRWCALIQLHKPSQRAGVHSVHRKGLDHKAWLALPVPAQRASGKHLPL